MSTRETVTLTICDTCGRDDRWTPLRQRHYAHGSLCTGAVVKHEYALLEAAEVWARAQEAAWDEGFCADDCDPNPYRDRTETGT